MEVSTQIDGFSFKSKSNEARVFFRERPEIQMASAGHYHNCALLAHGEVQCWGLNSSGQLGLGHRDNVEDGTVASIDLGQGLTATALAVGGYHSCALLNNGGVKCWGSNAWGQLGLGHKNALGDNPGEMGEALPQVDLGTNLTAKAIGGGMYHTCAILSNDNMKCWGNNDYGQLGRSHTRHLGDGPGEMGDHLSRVKLGRDTNNVPLTAKDMDLGVGSTCAIVNNDQLKCWGKNFYGLLGLGHRHSVGVRSGQMGRQLSAVDLGSEEGVPLTAKSVSVGRGHICAILSNDQLKCWGRNHYTSREQERTNFGLGDAPGEMGNHLPVVRLGRGLTAKSVTLGWDASTACVILSNDQLKCWGRNSYGQLGRGHSDSMRGDAIENLSGIDLGVTSTGVIVGGDHACSLSNNGVLKCWGRNHDGQLGRSTNVGNPNVGDEAW